MKDYGPDLCTAALLRVFIHLQTIFEVMPIHLSFQGCNKSLWQSNTDNGERKILSKKGNIARVT